MHKVLRALILSDFLILGSFGMVQPIFAIYMMQDIVGSTLIAVGVAFTIQLLTKSLMQIFVAKWTDDEPGNKREMWTLLAGSLLMSGVCFGYMFIQSLPALYGLQFLYGLGGAVAYPGWMVLFSRYSRSEKAGYEWSVYNSIVSMGMAAAAYLGAYVAETFSFKYLFLGMGIISLVGTVVLFSIFKHEFTREKK